MARRIGFVGLGTMGRPMALNLLKAGFTVRVFNRTEARMAPLVQAGAEPATSFADAAKNAEVVISMLADSPDVRYVLLGPDGALSGAGEGAIIVDMSTISPAVAAEIAGECRTKGVEFLDAPVTGGEGGAISGKLSIMVGGSAAALEQVRGVLEAMGSRITYMGPSGSGQMAKLCNQVICGLNILAVAEGLSLAKAAGLDTNVLLEAISGGSAASWMLANLAPKMLAEDWAPGFRIALQEKDLRLALDAADENSMPLLGTSLVKQLFESANAKGWGNDGTQALIKAIEMLGSG